MIGQIVVKVQVNTNLETAPDPNELLDLLRAAFKSVEDNSKESVKFGGMQFINLVTGLEVRKVVDAEVTQGP